MDGKRQDADWDHLTASEKVNRVPAALTETPRPSILNSFAGNADGIFGIDRSAQSTSLLRQCL